MHVAHSCICRSPTSTHPSTWRTRHRLARSTTSSAPSTSGFVPNVHQLSVVLSYSRPVLHRHTIGGHRRIVVQKGAEGLHRSPQAAAALAFPAASQGQRHQASTRRELWTGRTARLDNSALVSIVITPSDRWPRWIQPRRAAAGRVQPWWWWWVQPRRTRRLSWRIPRTRFVCTSQLYTAYSRADYVQAGHRNRDLCGFVENHPKTDKFHLVLPGNPERVRMPVA